MKLLIAIPTKSDYEYSLRMMAVKDTWLKNCPVDFKEFSDVELGLDPNSETIRPMRTKLMCKYALDHGYDYIFRVDSDAYVWVDRLLKCGFENHDYIGWCIDYPRHVELMGSAFRTAHGGIGFFLSRRAMQIVVDTPPWRQGDGNYWGDIWTGEVLWKNGIYCHRDTRFLDGSNGTQHSGEIDADELPVGHQYISVHPVHTQDMFKFHERFKNLNAETVAPERQIWWTDYKFDWGPRSVQCSCEYCNWGRR